MLVTFTGLGSFSFCSSCTSRSSSAILFMYQLFSSSSWAKGLRQRVQKIATCCQNAGPKESLRFFTIFRCSCVNLTAEFSTNKMRSAVLMSSMRNSTAEFHCALSSEDPLVSPKPGVSTIRTCPCLLSPPYQFATTDEACVVTDSLDDCDTKASGWPAKKLATFDLPLPVVPTKITVAGRDSLSGDCTAPAKTAKPTKIPNVRIVYGLVKKKSKPVV
mmetsp:Transcript_28823/g.69233  ORF Transcript_28823/g.69233 Transcript_28823/m.69233 type:complete len:217 (-) Transcript_28823:45-695(-)